MLQSYWLRYSLSIRQHKFVFTKTIRILALHFYEAIVNSGFALVNYQLIEIPSS